MKLIIPILIGFFAIFYTECSGNDLSDYNNDEYDAEEEEEEIIQDVKQPIVLKTQNQTFHKKLGENITLPCEVDGKSTSYVVQWLRNTSPLFLGTISQTNDKRYILHKNNALEINYLDGIDGTVFTCMIMASTQYIVTHRIILPSPPSITKFYPEEKGGNKFRVNAGESITFSCSAQGTEPISYTWYKVHQNTEEANDYSTFTINKVNRHQTALYICKAANLYGTDSKNVSLEVLYRPEIDSEEEFVNTAENLQTEILCIVHAHPSAKVTWYHQQKQLRPNVKYQFKTHGNKHILTITQTRKNDFGEYTCNATNSLGYTAKKIYLKGEPKKPKFHSTKSTFNGNTSIQWDVSSLVSLSQYEILYKKQQENDWVSNFSNNFQATSPGRYLITHTLSNLEIATYQVKLRAYNEYGSSEWSDISLVAVGNTDDSSTKSETQLLEASIRGIGSASTNTISFAFILAILFASGLFH